MIGINFSRLLSIIYGRTLATKINEEKASISVGRVMLENLEMKIHHLKQNGKLMKNQKYLKVLIYIMKQDLKMKKKQEIL